MRGPYDCSDCGAILRKARLNVYWCDNCETTWLLKPLNYDSFEEASLTNYEDQLRQDFLEPLTVPPKGQ